MLILLFCVLFSGRTQKQIIADTYNPDGSRKPEAEFVRYVALYLFLKTNTWQHLLWEAFFSSSGPFDGSRACLDGIDGKTVVKSELPTNSFIVIVRAEFMILGAVSLFYGHRTSSLTRQHFRVVGPQFSSPSSSSLHSRSKRMHDSSPSPSKMASPASASSLPGKGSNTHVLTVGLPQESALYMYTYVPARNRLRADIHCFYSQFLASNETSSSNSVIVLLGSPSPLVCLETLNIEGLGFSHLLILLIFMVNASVAFWNTIFMSCERFRLLTVPLIGSFWLCRAECLKLRAHVAEHHTPMVVL